MTQPHQTAARQGAIVSQFSKTTSCITKPMNRHLARILLLVLFAGCGASLADTWRPHGKGGDGRTFNEVWFADSSLGWAVGDDGMIQRTSDGGTTWSAEASGTTSLLYGVWGSSASNVWVVGGNSTVLRWNGTAWSSANSGIDNFFVFDIWGTGSDLWAVGGNGRIWRWNGSSWSVQSSGTTDNLYAVTGTSSSQVWAAGLNGTIVKWNGSTWSSQASGTTQVLLDMWAADASNVWAVGHNGTIVKWDGSAWSPQSSGVTNSLEAVWGTSADNVFVVGSSTARRWNGSTWGNSLIPPTSSMFHRALGGTSASHIIAVGSQGQTVRWNGVSWVQGVPSSSTLFNAVRGTSTNQIWAAGHSGIIMRWNGDLWASQTSGTSSHLFGLWLADASNVWAVGASGTIRKWNGTSWGGQTSGTTASLQAVWGADTSNLWAVGAAGTILKWNGSAWSAQTSGVSQILYGVWGQDASNVWAVGETGTILKWNGSAWAAQTSGTTQTLYAVWGTDASNVWAVGAGGTIRKWNGSAWSAQTSGTSTQLNSVWGVGTSQVWAVGNVGVIRKWNGSTWAADTSNTGIYRGAVWGLSASQMVAVGNSGSIQTNAAPAPEIAMSGNSQGILNGSLTPALANQTDFGSVSVPDGLIAVRIYSIINNGQTQLSLTGSPRVSLTGDHASDFLVTAMPAENLGSTGGATTFSISFTPSATGVRSALVTLPNNDPDEAPFTFAIKGTGTSPQWVFDNAMTAAGLTGPDALATATPKNDGVANLLKYAFNMTLTAPDLRVLTPGTGVAGLPSITRPSGGIFRVEFLQRIGSGLSYTPMKSAELTPGTWTALTDTPTVTPINAQWERVVYEEPLLPAETRSFAQVVVGFAP